MIVKQGFEYLDNGTVKMLKRQSSQPYYESKGVDDILRRYPYTVTKQTAYYLFMMGYIEGKRAERARRKRTT